MDARLNVALLILVLLATHAAPVACWENVALLSHGAMCHASSHLQIRHCTRALRGKQMPGGWCTTGEGVGSWLQIDFDAQYTLTYCRLMQRFSRVEQSKEVQLSFSHGVNKSVVLSKRVGHTYRDYRGQHWDEFRLDNIVTSYVRLDVISVYSVYNNGLIATEFYTGKNPCNVFYTFVQGHCYRYDIIKEVTWSDAQEICEHEGGELASLESAFELEVVSDWLEDAFDIDAVLWLYAVRGDDGWHWEDVSETWFEWDPTENFTSNRAALRTSTREILTWQNNTGFLCESGARNDSIHNTQASSTNYPSSGDIEAAPLRAAGDGPSLSHYIVTIAILSIAIVLMILGFIFRQYRRQSDMAHKRLSAVAIIDGMEGEGRSGPSHVSIIDGKDYS